MTTQTTRTGPEKLISIDEVSGPEPAVRKEVSSAGADAEAATAALRAALRELHRSDDEAWRRYAVDLEEATRRFDTTVGLAATRLRAERAASKAELHGALDEVAGSWRSRAEEIRVHAHLGRMDIHDHGAEAIADLERAGHRIGSLLIRLRDEVAESLTTMRQEARDALDEAAEILQGHDHVDRT